MPVGRSLFLDDEEQLCSAEDNYGMSRGYNLFFLMMTSYKFQMITIARKEQSILGDEEQLCSGDEIKCQEGTVCSRMIFPMENGQRNGRMVNGRQSLKVNTPMTLETTGQSLY